MALVWQYNLIARIDDVAHFQVGDPKGHPDFDFALRTKVRWSKNVHDERRCPDQILLGSMDFIFCVLFNLACYLEGFLRMFPNAYFLFTGDTSETAPAKFKKNHHNMLSKYAWKNPRMAEAFLPEHVEAGVKALGTHSYRKASATYASRCGATPQEIEHRGRWKHGSGRVVMRYIDNSDPAVDARVAGMLCQGGPIKYQLKYGMGNRITDDWLFTHVVPNIFRRFTHDTRFCRVLAMPMLYAYFDDGPMHERLPFDLITRLDGIVPLLGLEPDYNPVEKVSLHIYSSG